MEKLKRDTEHLFISIFAVLIKNFKTLFRSKTSIFTIIFGPLLIMTMLVLAFNNSSFYDIHIAAYSDSYGTISEGILKNLESNNYIVTKFNNKTDCLTGVKSGEYNLCLILSKNIEVTNDAKNKIEFYVDPSRINIVDNIRSNIDREIAKTSSNLSLELTNVLLKKLSSTKEDLNNKNPILDSLDSNNGKIKQSSEALKSSADSIDINVIYADFKFDDIVKDINRVNTSYNMSANDLKSLTDKLNVIGTQVNSTISKTDSAKTKIKDLSNSASGIPSIVSDNSEQVGKLRLGISDIVTSINNIAVTNPESIVNPIITEVHTLETQETHIGKFIPTFLVLIIMFVCILLSSSIILTERTSTAYLRNEITSTPKSVFLIGAYLTSLAIILFHLIVIGFMLGFVINFDLELFIPSILPLFLIVSMFIFIGMSIGYIARSQETVSVISLIVIAGALFFSNTILPLETLPLKLKEIILYNPFVVSESILKKIMIFSFSLDKVLGLLIRLLWFNGLLLLLTYLGLKFSKVIIRK